MLAVIISEVSCLLQCTERNLIHSSTNRYWVPPQVPTSAPHSELRETRKQSTFMGLTCQRGTWKINKTYCMPGGEIWLKKKIRCCGRIVSHRGSLWGTCLREFRKTLWIIGASRGAASGKQCRRHKTRKFHPWVTKIPWRRAWQPIPVFLPGESPWTEEPGWLLPIGLQRVGHNRSDLACRQVWVLENRTFQRGNFWPVKMKKKKKGKETRKQSEQGVLGDRASEEEGAARPCRDWQATVKTLDFTPNENIWLTRLRRNRLVAVEIVGYKGAGVEAGRLVKTPLHLPRWGETEVQPMLVARGKISFSQVLDILEM